MKGKEHTLASRGTGTRAISPLAQPSGATTKGLEAPRVANKTVRMVLNCMIAVMAEIKDEEVGL